MRGQNNIISIVICAFALTFFRCAPAAPRYTREPGAAAPPQSQTRSTVTAQRGGRQATPKRMANTNSRLEQVVASYVGTPYKYGGMSRNGMDCSGFVTLVYAEVYGKKLPRSSGKMWQEGRLIPVSAARPGDLVFFKGGSFGAIDHVGVYMGNNRFVHASTSRGVVYDNLSDTYYSRRFAGVRRMI